jgi:hypothetical protein
MMLVVLTYPHDAAARTLVDRWRSRGARLMVPRDLSQPGWRHYVGGCGEEWFVSNGERLRTDVLSGVMTRMPSVRAQDLTHIAREDREYVAAEMDAFLASWLTRLRCPVLNRPVATSLMGPNRSRERWLLLAASAGLRPAARRSLAPGGDPAPATAAVTVVGRCWVGAVAPQLGAQAVCLAERAGVDLLTVQFDGPDRDAAFVCAELSIDVSSDEVADALLARLDAGVVA